MPNRQTVCIMGSHNFKGTASSVFGVHCWLQSNIHVQPQEGADLWCMTSSAQKALSHDARCDALLMHIRNELN